MVKMNGLGVLLLAALAGCQDLGSEGMPPNQPIAGQRFSSIHTGMTYAEFERTFGDGWSSHSLGTDAKYWFFDDGRTLVVSADVWKSPDVPLKYHVIGTAPESRIATMPILPGPTDIDLNRPRQ